ATSAPSGPGAASGAGRTSRRADSARPSASLTRVNGRLPRAPARYAGPSGLARGAPQRARRGGCSPCAPAAGSRADRFLCRCGSGRGALGLAVGVFNPIRGRLVDTKGQRKTLTPLAFVHVCCLAILVVLAVGDAPPGTLVAP